MKKLILAGLIALTALSSCSWICDSDCDCEPAQIVCGEPTGSLVVIPNLRPINAEGDGVKYLVSEWEEDQTDTVVICDLPRTYLISVLSNPDYLDGYDTIDWELPVEAFDIEYRYDIQSVVFSVSEGSHTISYRVKKEPLQFSNWYQWHWTLTLKEDEL